MKFQKLLATTAICTAITGVGLVPSLVWAQSASSNATYIIVGNDDGSNHPEEGISFQIGGASLTDLPRQTQMQIERDRTVIYDGLVVSGYANVTSNVSVGGTATVSGATTLNGALDVNGASELRATTIVGATSITGQTTVSGDTSITGATTVAGTTSISGNTTINTTSGNSTKIGSSDNTTELLSNQVNLGTGNYATTVAIGSGAADTNVGIAAGSNNDNAVRLSAAGADSIIVRTDVVDGEIQSRNTAVLIEAANINGDDEGADIDIIAADSIDVQAGDDFDVTSIDRTRFETSRFYVNVGATSGNIGDAGVAIAGNGEVDRWIADENGSIRKVSGDEVSAAGNTAAIVVTNPTSGQNHGLVVQETKTTLSGGINSASMTLDDRGATFSDPADGAPIQVHGVADGTAPFDAVNVRQLYSGLASVLASTPDIELAPGRTGMAIGLGGYGGYSAIGIGFGHMYDNGTTLRASASKGEYSEVAYRASVSWNW